MSGGRKMKSAVFYGKHDIKVEEVEMPQLGNQDVLIKVMALSCLLYTSRCV